MYHTYDIDVSFIIIIIIFCKVFLALPARFQNHLPLFSSNFELVKLSKHCSICYDRHFN